MPETYTIQAAIARAKRDLTWHVTPNAGTVATVRYLDAAGRRKQVEIGLASADKAAELTREWLDGHESLDAAIDSVLYVSTPAPIKTHY